MDAYTRSLSLSYTHTRAKRDGGGGGEGKRRLLIDTATQQEDNWQVYVAILTQMSQKRDSDSLVHL